jgi:superfamily II DNA or RNA helicase
MLFDWQKPQASHLVKTLQSRKIALDASDTGTGKTFIACDVVKTLELQPLVICPKSVFTAWKKTLELFGVEPLAILNIEKLKTGKTQWLDKKNRGKLMTDWSWRLPSNTIIVWDEIHQAGGLKSQNGKLLALLKAYPIPVLGLSATVADSPLRLKALGYLMGFHKYADFDKWCRTLGCYTSPFGYNQLEFPKGRSRLVPLKRLHSQIFPTFGGRLRIDDLKEFPECTLQADSYDMSECKAIQDVYDELEDSLHDLDNDDPPIVKLLRARENVELLKTPLFAEQTAELVEEGKSVVIFFSYRGPAESLVERLTKKLGKVPGFIYGGQTVAERDEVIRSFQADENPALVVMIQAGGVGISLHDLHGNRPRVSLINPPYSVVHLKQALGRIWRAGAKTKAIQRVVFAAGTVEEKACEAVRRKLGNLNMLNDGELVAGLNLEPEEK